MSRHDLTVTVTGLELRMNDTPERMAALMEARAAVLGGANRRGKEVPGVVCVGECEGPVKETEVLG